MPDRPPRICLTPHTTTGGIASFRLKFTAGAQRNGVEVTEDLYDPNIQALLVIGGTKNIPALLRIRQRGIPVIQRLNGMNWVYRARKIGLRHTLRSLYGNWVLNLIRTRIATNIIYQSEFSQSWWHREYGPAPVASRIIYNGVDLEEYHPDGSHNRPSDHFRLLVVEGSLAGGYDFGLANAVHLGEALAEHHKLPIRVMVASKVPDDVRAFWDHQARIPVQWAGLVPRSQIPTHDRSSHAMFPPDPNAACPNSVIEALACGTPILAFQTGSLPELVSPEAGRLTPYNGDPWRLDPPDIRTLADASVDVFQNQEPFRRGARARAEERFGLDEMVTRYLDALLAPSFS